MPISLGFGLGVAGGLAPPSGAGGDDLTPPEGFGFVVDGDGAYVVDGDGAYEIAEIE